jgi:hypothetical protein
MKKWVISACVYLFFVIGSYTAYDLFIGKQESAHNAAASHETEEIGEFHGHNGADGGHGHEESSEKSGEIIADFSYKSGIITITLSDLKGNPVEDLVVNHEKLLHLIVVDDHLEQYLHLHPEKIGKGKFELNQPLKEGSYKAFVDIKSKSLHYQVQPLPFLAGDPQKSHSHETLVPDTSLVKTNDGQTAELEVSSFEAVVPVTLNFKLDETVLEQYLGAAGHVVILNEKADQYLHVHPKNEQKPIFETQFDQPGRYKIWAEFKQAGKVRVFSYVIEIR